MTNKKRVADFIADFPQASNEEIATTLNINGNSVKSYISQLKLEGYIEITGSGNTRKIVVKREYLDKSSGVATAEKIELKRDVYTKLLQCYLDDFELTDDIDKHLKLGNSILRILENI